MSTETLASLMGAGKFSLAIEEGCIRWGITKGEDKARFIAQMHVESQGFTRLEENFNYRAERLVAVFGNRNGLTLPVARSLVIQGKQAIANYIYGGAWGRKNLGNIETGDGWRFRGRGLKQLTGRFNYTQASQAIYGDDRLVRNPDLLLGVEAAVDTACWFWMSRDCNGITDIERLTRLINGGTNGLDERRKQTERAYRMLQSLHQKAGG